MHPYTSYLICATHRTGSTLLCEALTNTGLAGQPNEYFWSGYEPLWRERWGASSYADYLSKALEYTTTPNGVFGCKIMWAYFDDFLSNVRQVPGYAELPVPILLSTIFPNLRYIRITRRDKVQQAVSMCRAVQTQLWEQRTDVPAASAPAPIFDYDAIDYWLHTIRQDEAAWQQAFAAWGITPFTVVYEDFVTAYEATARAILSYLNIRVPEQLVFGERRLRQQADELSESWVQRYYQLKGELPADSCHQGEPR